MVFAAGVFLTEDGVEAVVTFTEAGAARGGVADGGFVFEVDFCEGVFLLDWGVLTLGTDTGTGPFRFLAGVLSSSDSSLASSEHFLRLEFGVRMFLLLVLLGGTYSSSESSEGL